MFSMKLGKYIATIALALTTATLYCAITYAADFIYAKKSSLWPQSQIPVCWEQMDPQFANERGWVRDQMTKSWSANSSVTFVGWQACASSANDAIRIQVDDAQPRTIGLGTELRGVPNGMRLNFTFTNFSRDWCQAPVAGRREHCIRVVAMHEFGHALSFSHEQNRADAPDWCHQEASGTNGDLMVTDFDINSVMNYCRNASWPATAMLSAFDIVGLQRVYGKSGGVIPSDRTAFALNLQASVQDCNNMQASRSLPCVAAIHRVCGNGGRGTAGISQEVNSDKGVFGVGCFNVSNYQNVGINILKNHAPDCSQPALAQTPGCVAAAGRWCNSNGLGTAGIAQEANADASEIGIACINAKKYHLALSALQAEHKDCANGESVQNQECLAAAHRWCVKGEKGVLGLVQETDGVNVWVACFDATWYGEIALH